MTSNLTNAIAAVLLLGLVLYALLGGADFGAGLWDLVAGGPQRGASARTVIEHAITPVWEANHVWLVFDLVILWTAFPSAFSAIMSTLFIPLVLALFGIVVRGAGFAYRKEVRALRARQVFGAGFAGASLITPFFMGTVVGAIATGQVRAGHLGDLIASWTGPEPLLIGGLFVATCAFLSGVYLCTETKSQRRPDLENYFVRRTLAAGLAGGMLALASLIELHFVEPWLFNRLVGRSLGFVIASGACALATQGLLLRGTSRFTRVLAGAAVTLMIWAWGFAQYPEVFPRTLSLSAASAPGSSIVALLAVFAIVAVFVIPSFVLLFLLAQRQHLVEDERDVEGSDIVGLTPALSDAGLRTWLARRLRPLDLALAFLIGIGAGISLGRERAARRARRRR